MHASSNLAGRDDVGVQRGEAVLLMVEKRLDEAEQLIRAVMERAPVSTHDEWVLAAIELMRRNPDADRRLSAVVDKGPVTLRATDTAGLYEFLGNSRMAAKSLVRI